MLGVYKDFAETSWRCCRGWPENRERKVRRAERTYSIEALMRDGRALQAARRTPRQNFAKVFDSSSRRATSPFSTCTGRHGAFDAHDWRRHHDDGDDGGLILPRALRHTRS